MNKNISGGVNAAKGFMANGLNAGIKIMLKRYGTCIQRKAMCGSRCFYNQ